MEAGMKFAADTIKRIPQGDPEALEAHLTGVLIMFWGALWGSLGTEYANAFISAQLRSMKEAQRLEVFNPPRMQ